MDRKEIEHQRPRTGAAGENGAGIQRILIGYDGFERNEPIPALAMALAEEHGAALHVLHVTPSPPHRAWRSTTISADGLQRELVEERRRGLEERLEPARTKGLEAHAVVRSGSPHLEIIRHAMSIDADLLIVVDEPMGRDGRRGFGTVTRKLLRQCPCPVLAKRDHRRLQHARILAAVDVEPSAPDVSPPNRLVLDMAGILAERAASRLFVFHAWSLWAEHLLRRPGRMKEAEVDELLARTECERQHELDRLVGACLLETVDVETLLLQGDPRTLLPRVVVERRIDLVVMGTICRSGVAGAWIGNTAEKILNELPCSVLAVKPEWFVSPVARMTRTT